MPFILTYSETAHELNKIIGSLEEATFDEPRFRLRADDLLSLCDDIDVTHRECPDVPHLDTLAERLRENVDRLIDRSQAMTLRRDTVADTLIQIHAQLLSLADQKPADEEYVAEVRGSSEPVELLEGQTLADRHTKPQPPKPPKKDGKDKRGEAA